jgi:hypothetical protein
VRGAQPDRLSDSVAWRRRRWIETPRRIEPHVKLYVLALQMRLAAEIRCGQPCARIARALGALKAMGYRCESRTIVQRTKVAAELSATLKP